MIEKNEKIENYIKLMEKINTVVYSNEFFSLNEINKIQKAKINYSLKGLNEDSEKKVIAFYPKDFPEEYLNFPVRYFKIIKKSKFIKLEHKHYLGNILSLGIKREIMGDLVVKDEICYGIIMENMFSFLEENLTKINSSPVEILEIEENEIPKSEFQVLNITLSSLRIDSLVAELTNLSRNLSVQHIDLGNVQINYEVEREKDRKIEIGDVIIIKKYGKFKIEEENGLTKKNKNKLIVKKYV